MELLIRNLSACIPDRGRLLLSLDLSPLLVVVAFFNIDFASSTVNSLWDATTSRLAFCTCSSNADGDDDDMDRGEDVNAGGELLLLCASVLSLSSFGVRCTDDEAGCFSARAVSIMERSSGVRLMPCNFPMGTC